jgi:MYXO-CTERM domain-containing protein
VRGWTGSLTYIGVPAPSIPAPAPLLLLVAGFGLLAGVRRRLCA